MSMEVNRVGVSGDITVHCDVVGCANEHFYNDTDFKGCADEIKDNGWSITHSEGDFFHYCKDCSSERNY